jgi:hypothetical protein
LGVLADCRAAARCVAVASGGVVGGLDGSAPGPLPLATAGSRNTVKLMSEAFEELYVELEDAATRSWLVSMLGTLAEKTQQWHFVGMVDGELRYHSGTFAAPYSWGHLPLGPTMLPREEWTPGMAEGLDSLRRELAEAGWIEVGKGGQPWQLICRRPAPSAG